MPVNIETAYKDNQLQLLGFSAKLNLIEMYENKNTPICFPKNKPHTIPSGTGFRSALKLTPSSETPAFANANNGMIPKATYFEIPCSNLNNNDLEGFFLLDLH